MEDFLPPDKMAALRKESPEIQNQVLDKYFPTLKQETPDIQAQVRQKYGLAVSGEPDIGTRASMLIQQNPIGLASAEASIQNPVNQMPFGQKVLTAISNVPQNAVDVAKDTYNVFRHPVDTATNLVTAATHPMDILGKIKDFAEHPINNMATRIIEKPVNYALDVAGIKGLAGAAEKAINPELATVVKQGVDKAIRPTVAGKTSISDIKAYDAKAVDAVTNIVKNKDNLVLTTPEGEAFRGLPQTLYQTGEAISQTKSSLWKQIDAAEKATGKAGLTVDTHPISLELQKIAKDRVVNDLSPGIAKLADNLSMRFYKGTYTVDEAETAIQQLNDKLKAFYKNPTYEATRPAALDALVVNNLRKGLDAAVSKVQGPGFQELKNSYGALKAIESDVAHRAGIVARQNKAGLVDFSNMYTAAHYARGLIAMDPASIGSASAVWATKKYIKWLNNPDRQIASMFKKADNIISPTKTQTFLNALPSSKNLANMTLQTNRLTLPQNNSIQDALSAR